MKYKQFLKYSEKILTISGVFFVLKPRRVYVRSIYKEYDKQRVRQYMRMILLKDCQKLIGQLRAWLLFISTSTSIYSYCEYPTFLSTLMDGYYLYLIQRAIPLSLIVQLSGNCKNIIIIVASSLVSSQCISFFGFSPQLPLLISLIFHVRLLIFAKVVKLDKSAHLLCNYFPLSTIT